MSTPQVNFAVKLDDPAFILPQLKIAKASTQPVTAAGADLGVPKPALVANRDTTLGFVPAQSGLQARSCRSPLVRVGNVALAHWLMRPALSRSQQISRAILEL